MPVAELAIHLDLPALLNHLPQFLLSNADQSLFHPGLVTVAVKLGVQGFRIFHACLWLVMWSETLAALEFSVLKQHCSRPRKWSNLNQAALNRLLTQRKYQAINCTSVYNDKQIS